MLWPLLPCGPKLDCLQVPAQMPVPSYQSDYDRELIVHVHWVLVVGSVAGPVTPMCRCHAVSCVMEGSPLKATKHGCLPFFSIGLWC